MPRPRLAQVFLLPYVGLLSSSFLQPRYAYGPDAHDALSLFQTLPASHSNVNVVVLNRNLAVLPELWELPELNAKLERIQSFPADENHVHEAPVYLPATNELLFSDTSFSGWLWAIEIDTYETRNLHTTPPLEHVNGGIYKDGEVYLATNGGKVWGLYRLKVTSGHVAPVLNNYRGRRLNSPNDLIFDSEANILFTDPPYGWHNWPGVQAPELPNAIYHFNARTGAMRAMSNSVVSTPNGLALSPDGSTLYVAGSNSSLYSGSRLTSVRNVWAFDIKSSLLSNPGLVYQAESGWPDGLHVTQRGLLMVAVSGGVDVVDPASGLLLGKINTPDDIIYNLEPVAGRDPGVWMLMGKRHIYKVTMSERGCRVSTLVRVPMLYETVSKARQVASVALRRFQQQLHSG